MSILTNQNLDISNDGQAIILIYQRVGSSTEDNVWDHLGLLVHVCMLPDGHCNSKVMVGEVWANSFITHHDIDTNDGILRILGSLE